MKKHLLAVVLAGLAALAGAAPAVAQDWESGVRADVPFAFTVGGKTLPAGMYTIRRPNVAVPDVYEIAGAKRSRNEALFEADETAAPARPSKSDDLVFVRTGDDYVLTRIDSGPDGSSLMLPRTKAERRMLAGGRIVTVNCE